MSLYTTWINLIKEQADELWLTDGQRRIYDQLLAHWEQQAFVNLYGPQGSGKTFIARLLAKSRGYALVHDLGLAPVHAPQVVLDDAEYTRRLRPLAHDLGLGRVLLISQAPFREAMPKIELALNAHDVYQFCANLSERCGISLIRTVAEGLDLDEILRREVIARGESHVSG